ncbi:hypothetical protein QAD02_013629 [Eretmocerus hayati]|uniref:Uncharacterized protein n=1 Tax=Eretmocerus hayati TaxID=131215 RepID=A0ACC2P381_9HYME|nr:hypothetical protein QAD02_013629 [Eretmocerus hayati]
MAKGKSPSRVARDLRRSQERRVQKLASQEEENQQRLVNSSRNDLEVVVNGCAVLESSVKNQDAGIKKLKIENRGLQAKVKESMVLFNFHELVKWKKNLEENKV